MTYSPFFHIRCLLEDITPPVWRSLRVPQWLTFGQLEHLVRSAFGWAEEAEPTGRYTLSSRVLSADAAGKDDHVDGWRLLDWFAPGMRLLLTTGSGWQISIQVVGLAPDEPDNMTTPSCLAGERAAPPEEVEGPGGYLKLLKHPKQRGLWNPERFDLTAINQALAAAALPLTPMLVPQRSVSPALTLEGPGFFLKENDVQFDLHAYYLELETAYWLETCPQNLKEALTSLEREELLGLCMVYGLPADAAFRRTQMEKLLRMQLPDAIRLQVPYLDDRQYGLLRQVVDSPDGQVRFARADMLFSPYELYYFRDRLLLYPRLTDGESYLYMLPEIRDALRMDPMQSLSRTQLQNANRRRILCGMFQYYGIMTMASLQEVLSELLGESIDQDTLVVDIQELQDFYDAVSIGDMLVMHTALDPDSAATLWAQQLQYAGLPYRKLSLETLDLAGDWMFVEATNEAEILISFLESRYGLNTGAAEGIAWELMHRFRWGEPLEAALEMAGDALRHPDEAAERRFAELVAQVWVHAPAWRYKGWSPADVKTFLLQDDDGWTGVVSEDYSLAMKLIQADSHTVEIGDASQRGDSPATGAAPGYGAAAGNESGTGHDSAAGDEPVAGDDSAAESESAADAGKNGASGETPRQKRQAGRILRFPGAKRPPVD